MDDESRAAITPQNERTVDFYGDPIPVAQFADELFVPLRPLATFLGLDQAGQYQRVRRDDVLAKRVRRVLMRGASGRLREQLCLPLDLLPGWLFGITTARVSDELRAKLNRYREECFRVLWNAFKADITPALPAAQSLTPAEQMLQQTEALYKLAQQQVELERQQKLMADYTRGFIRDTRTNLADHEQRLVSLEMRLDPAANVTDEQAAEIALGVKNLAYAMGGGSASYGKVYSELYRRYRVSSYKNLPRSKYDEVIAWLGRWYDEVSKNDKAEAADA